ncbi:MAG TPA: hypothetical protein VEH81_01580, partial [Ktedonobacteraceae bacterium]|nr:hypothetical protein [Ktedonobacteraceae bacterium]
MSNQAQVGSSTNPTELTKDTAFKNIYYAFQLGWSIIELKSRILTTAPGTNTHQQSKPLVDTANPGQNQAVQLFSRESQVQESQQYTTALPDSAWLTSLWRATFNRIVECHKCCFPDGTTAGTLYDIPAPLNSQQYE